MTYALTLEQPRTRAGLRDAVRAEWRKLVSLRSTAWALLITLAGTVLVSYLSARGARHTHVPAGFYQGFDPTNTALAGLALGSLVMGILGVMSMTGEYGSGTIRSSLAAVPRRGVFFSAKVIVFGAAALVIGMAMSFLSFFVGQAELSGGAPTATLADPGVLRILVESGAFLALLALFAVGLGAIIRHSAGAIAAFVGCTLLLPLLLHSVPGDVVRYTPTSIFANSVADLTPTNGALSSTAGFILMAGYAIVSLSVGAILLARRDA
jgi:ABC-type transport system involved in multi-copper enzyme maturation permease subunit